MKIALVGYGKMGKLIEQLAPEYGCEVALKLDEFNNAGFAGLTAQNFSVIPVPIEFSVPSATVEYVERLAALGVNVVLGTTGWLDELPRVSAAMHKHGRPPFWIPTYLGGLKQ